MNNHDFKISDDEVKGLTKGEEKAYSYEEAIEKVQIGKFHYLLLLIAGMCFMACIIEITALGLIVVPAKCDLQFTLAQQGLLGSAGYMGVAVSSHFMGFLADTWGRVRSLRSMLLVSLCTSLISAMSVNVWMLFVLRFLTGVFIAGCQASVYSLIGEFHSSKTRVRHVSMASIFLTWGLVYVPALAYVILPLNIDVHFLGVHLLPWRILMICYTIPCMLGLVGVFWLPESPKYLLSQGKHIESVDILRKIYSMNSGNPKQSYYCDTVTLKDVSSDLSKVKGVLEILKLVWSQTISLFAKGRVFQTLNMCTIAFIMNLISKGTFLYLPIIINNLISHTDNSLTICETFEVAVQKHNHTLEDMCTDPSSMNVEQYEYLTYTGFSFMMVYVFNFAVIDYTGKKLLLLGWIALSGVCSLLLQYVDNMVLVLACLSIIVALSNCLGIISTVALEFYPTNINVMGVSFVMLIGRLGAVVGTNIVGPLLSSYCGPLFSTYTGSMALIYLLVVVLPNGSDKKRRFCKFF